MRISLIISSVILGLLMLQGQSCQKNGSQNTIPPPTPGEDNTNEPEIEKDPDATIKIGTYNIEGPTATRANSTGYWPNRKDNVIKTIQNADFDILGTQETSKEMLADICNGLKQYKWIGSYRLDYTSVNGIVYKHQRLKLLDSGRFYYSPTPDVDYTSDPDDEGGKQLNCIWAKFEDRKTGVILYLFDTHFHAHYTNAMRDTLRCRDARLLKERVRTIAGDNFAFCTGDFNCTEEWYDNNTGKYLHAARPGYVELMKGGVLTDTRTVAENKKNDWESSIPGFTTTGMSDNDSKYDHVFLSNLAKGSYKVTMYEVITDSYVMTHTGTTTTRDPIIGIANGQTFQSNCSDHRPVTATIQFIQNPDDENNPE